MSVYRKLNQAREEFHKIKLKKSGYNTFAKYGYFNLSDFLVPALNVFQKHGLCGVVTFDKEIAMLSIIDVDKPEDRILITSPMGSATLKGCHEVQNIGAVETYQRRYLWMAALEILEHDSLDSTVTETVELELTEYEMTHLPDLEGSARLGLKALEMAFKKLEKSDEKAALWQKHSERLKNMAEGK